MKLLVLGNGGREHALAWKAAQSASVEQVYVAPGNAGTALEKHLINVDLNPLDFDAIVAYVREIGIDLTIVGPEAPLVEGIVDRFQTEGLAVFGPTQAAAQLEGSKSFAKAFMKRHKIPTSDYEVFTNLDAAKAYIQEQSYPLVIKADGLAAGKGVVIAQDQQEADQALESMLEGQAFGEAGHRVVIESFLEGEEASYIALLDGKTLKAFASSQDHKARDNGDQGPNTGGMGAYSPAPVVTPEVEAKILKRIMYPTMEGLAAEGMPYTGFLYAGVMIDGKGDPYVVEYNCRFGDPETQPIMMRLESDLVEACLAAVNQTLETIELKFCKEATIGVVMASCHNNTDRGFFAEFQLNGFKGLIHSRSAGFNQV